MKILKKKQMLCAAILTLDLALSGSATAQSLNNEVDTPISMSSEPAFSDANWQSMGSLVGLGLGNVVLTSAVDNSGNLYIGGWFDFVGSINATNIARWDGSQWHTLGPGVNGMVRALAIVGSDLYVGGSFTLAGDVTISNIAKWDGTQWSAVGSGIDNTVNALAVLGPNLYVGGSFTCAGGVQATNVALWNGSTWSSLGTGVPGTRVKALTTMGGKLYAGGIFAQAGGVPAKNIAQWDGTNWSALVNIMDGNP